MTPPATAAPTKASTCRPPASMSRLPGAALAPFVATLAAPFVAVDTIDEPPCTTPEVTVPKTWEPPDVRVVTAPAAPDVAATRRRGRK
ncbi:hypothetical protein BDZ90DRAFT_234628 [Jaminaea rosea]|uniref:Uncharacterized protein n=1 Tax=Jaminaea rosea TaxID=1569628 RepID=A0A316UM53_9BASI|nr:hypothetical protein BDZ90DRAFT_234628 [Jaminaea rosea]PWN25023.1 hypothetical protein BDZ90DRAFT_234628 [Jaminaea rosea]